MTCSAIRTVIIEENTGRPTYDRVPVPAVWKYPKLGSGRRLVPVRHLSRSEIVWLHNGSHGLHYTVVRYRDIECVAVLLRGCEADRSAEAPLGQKVITNSAAAAARSATESCGSTMKAVASFPVWGFWAVTR